MKIYSATFSPNAFRVLAVAYELNLDFELVEVDVMKGGTKTPEYLELNPNGKVPVLQDEDFVLWESRPMMAYLASLKPEQGLYPEDIKSRAIVDQWMYWQAIHLGPAMQKIAFERLFKAKFGMGDPDENAIEQQLKDVEQFMPVLNEQLAGKDWITGTFTIADFAVMSTFLVHTEAGISLGDAPNVAKWVKRMNALPSWKQATDPFFKMMA